MDEYREYIFNLRELEVGDVYFLLHENMTPSLSRYVKMVRDLKFEDGTYHTYYGELKKTISSFQAYYNEKIDKSIREVDKYMHTSTKEIIMDLCERTIDKFTKKQKSFEFEVLPVRCAAEKECYERIKNKLEIFVEKVNEMHAKVKRLDKQFKVDAFARNVLPASITGDYKKFKYTHLFLSRMVAARITDIDTSISEVMIRVCHVFKKLQSHCEEAINTLLHQLYNVNKESLRLHRRHRRCTIDNAEVNKSISLIRQKIDELYPQDTPLRRLQEEVQYWTRKSQEIDYIATALAKLKNERKDLEAREQTILQREEYCSCYSEEVEDDLDPITLPIIKKRKADIEEQCDEVARCLFTFFSLRGSNIVFYRDTVGQYYVDEYGHKVYSFDYGLELCYLQNDGAFVDVAKLNHLYFDEYGGYIYEEHVENVSVSTMSTASSTSKESLLFDSSEDDNGLVSKQQSVMLRSKARLDKRKEFMQFNIKDQLDKETVTYLWDVFGSILPNALYDVFIIQPKNPVHCLAHCLLKHKYSRSTSEAKEKRDEAEKYRATIHREEQEKAKAEATIWKSKLVKRRKPEESYDIENQLTEAIDIARRDFIIGINFTSDLM